MTIFCVCAKLWNAPQERRGAGCSLSWGRTDSSHADTQYIWHFGNKIQIDDEQHPPKRLMNVDISIPFIQRMRLCLCVCVCVIVVDKDWNYFRDICCDRSVTYEFIFVNVSAGFFCILASVRQSTFRDHTISLHKIQSTTRLCESQSVVVAIGMRNVCKNGSEQTTKNSRYFNL